MPDNQFFNSTEEQKKILKKYADKLQNPDQIKQLDQIQVLSLRRGE